MYWFIDPSKQMLVTKMKTQRDGIIKLFKSVMLWVYVKFSNMSSCLKFSFLSSRDRVKMVGD